MNDPLIDQVNWISMRSFKQSSTPSRISSSIYTPFIIAFMYVMRQNLWQEISHIGTFITEYAQPRFTFWLFRPNHDIVDIECSSKITLSHWFLPFGVFEFLRRGFCRGGTRYSIGRWIHRCTGGGGSVTRGIFLIAADTACSSCQVGTRHQRRVFDLIASIFTCNADQKKKLSCLYASILVRKCIGVNQIMSDIVATAKKWMKPYRSFAYLPPFAFEKLPSRENEQGLMANATEMPSFKMLCTNNNEFTGGAAHVATAAAAHSVKSGS